MGALGRSAPELSDQGGIRPSVGRAEPHVGAASLALRSAVMWSERARVHLHHHEVGRPPGHDVDVRQQLRRDRVGDEAGEPLLEPQRVGHAHDVTGPILDAEHEPASRAVRERDQGSECRPRGGHVPLELEGLALGLAEDDVDRHATKSTTKYSVVPGLRSSVGSHPPHGCGDRPVAWRGAQPGPRRESVGLPMSHGVAPIRPAPSATVPGDHRGRGAPDRADGERDDALVEHERARARVEQHALDERSAERVAKPGQCSEYRPPPPSSTVFRHPWVPISGTLCVHSRTRARARLPGARSG